MGLLRGFVLAAFLAAPVADTLRYEVYPLGLMDTSTAAELVRPLLSVGGQVVEDAPNHRLIVYDRDDAHRRIAAALQATSVAPRNVRIVVTGTSERTTRREGVGVSGAGRVGGVRIGGGRFPPESGVEVRGGASRSRSRDETLQELLVLSGGRAGIVVAEELPYRDWFQVWGKGYGLWEPGVRWKDVGARMVVEPTILADHTLRVRLTPEFTYLLDRQTVTTEVRQLTTDVVVREGEEIDLGGLPISDRQFLDRFLVGFDQGGQTVRARITLKASVD